MSGCLTELLLFSHSLFCYSFRPFTYLFRITEKIVFDNEWMMKANATAPAINVIENEKDYKIQLAAPGMTKNDFTVNVDENNNLVICMEKKEEKNEEKKDKKYLRREFSYSKFQQSIILPDNVEKDKITAKVEHGILSIDIPKTVDKEVQKITRTIDIK